MKIASTPSIMARFSDLGLVLKVLLPGCRAVCSRELLAREPEGRRFRPGKRGAAGRDRSQNREGPGRTPRDGSFSQKASGRAGLSRRRRRDEAGGIFLAFSRRPDLKGQRAQGKLRHLIPERAAALAGVSLGEFMRELGEIF